MKLCVEFNIPPLRGQNPMKIHMFVVGQMQIIVLLKKLEDLMAVFKHYLITRK
jgi:hypothetical protein